VTQEHVLAILILLSSFAIDTITGYVKAKKFKIDTSYAFRNGAANKFAAHLIVIF
jgi:hypothetical protein